MSIITHQKLPMCTNVFLFVIICMFIKVSDKEYTIFQTFDLQVIHLQTFFRFSRRP